MVAAIVPEGDTDHLRQKLLRHPIWGRFGETALTLHSGSRFTVAS